MHDPVLYANVWKIIGRSLSGILPTYSGRVYYQAAPLNTTFPILVYQPVVNQAFANLMLNDSYWDGAVVFRSVSTSFADAQERLGTVAMYLDGVVKTVTISGLSPYTVQYTIRETPSFPVERLTDGYIYTAAITTETVIFPTDY